jgi:hypothetical protein
VVAAGAVAAAVCLPAVALASPQAPGSKWDPSEIVAFSDTNFGPAAPDYPYDLNLLSSAYCTGTGDRTKVPSLTAAVQIADKLVNADTGGKGIAEFARTKYGHSEVSAIGTAVGEIASGRPAVALDALLRAHQLAPHDPVPLIDAAPLLTQAGKAQAALQFLAAAARLKMPTITPFGVSFTALLENNEGQALLGTHQFGAAVTMLNKAVRASSVLREARQLLGPAYLCAKNKPAALRFLVAGTFRQSPGAAFAIVDKRDPNPADVLDTAHGKQLQLPVYSYPATMQLGATEGDLWGNLQTDVLIDQVGPMNKKVAADNAALIKAEAHMNPLTKARTNQILADIGDAPALVPELVTLENKAGTTQLEIRNLQLKGEGEAGCLNSGLHAQWLSDVQAYDTQERDAAKADYKMETAFASNLRNPLAHRLGVELAELQSMFSDSLLISAGQGLVGYDGICYKGTPGTPPDSVSSGNPSTPASDPCPTSIPHFSLKLGTFASLSINCESVSYEVAPEGELFFISSEHNFKNGHDTVFVGVKGDIGIASAHVGAYATFDQGGHAIDVGGRGATDVTLGGADPVSFGVDGPSAQVGVAGGLSVTIPGDSSPVSE